MSMFTLNNFSNNLNLVNHFYTKNFKSLKGWILINPEVIQQNYFYVNIQQENRIFLSFYRNIEQ